MKREHRIAAERRAVPRNTVDRRALGILFPFTHDQMLARAQFESAARAGGLADPREASAQTEREWWTREESRQQRAATRWAE